MTNILSHSEQSERRHSEQHKRDEQRRCEVLCVVKTNQIFRRFVAVLPRCDL